MITEFEVIIDLKTKRSIHSFLGLCSRQLLDQLNHQIKPSAGRVDRRSTRPDGTVQTPLFNIFEQTKDGVEITSKEALSIVIFQTYTTEVRFFGYIDVGEFMLVTIFGCWRQNFDIGDLFWMLLPDANNKKQRMLATKSAKTVTNVSKLSPTYFVSNIRRQHRCSRFSYQKCPRHIIFSILQFTLMRIGVKTITLLIPLFAVCLKSQCFTIILVEHLLLKVANYSKPLEFSHLTLVLYIVSGFNQL